LTDKTESKHNLKHPPKLCCGRRIQRTYTFSSKESWICTDKVSTKLRSPPKSNYFLFAPCPNSPKTSSKSVHNFSNPVDNQTDATIAVFLLYCFTSAGVIKWIVLYKSCCWLRCYYDKQLAIR